MSQCNDCKNQILKPIFESMSMLKQPETKQCVQKCHLIAGMCPACDRTIEEIKEAGREYQRQR